MGLVEHQTERSAVVGWAVEVGLRSDSLEVEDGRCIVELHIPERPRYVLREGRAFLE